MTSENSGTAALAQAAVAAGWRRIASTEPQAYTRKGLRFLTWCKNGVTVATSGACLVYNPERGVTELYESNGAQAVVEFLGVAKELRGQGLARQALQEWVDLAQACAVELFLQPEPQERGMSRARLIALYQGVGFAPCGGVPSAGSGLRAASIKVMALPPGGAVRAAR